MGSEPLHIWFNKMDGFIKIYGGIRYLVLLGNNWYAESCDRISYLISEKKVLHIAIIIFAGIRIDSYNSSTIKRLTFHKVIILIKSVVNKWK